ncbi:hypothetical protein LJY25_18725 [Hymenobacter sp. BT175]|uniref:hypothetical protein n=1 Tax=Hymenobacter translucens TaxID=2886507 RepID=UPI001D0EF847|nr:hypothetical protein [Hymenobacter translucens]MCC2548489.1 hypothetical protein [Hymenobacter translucens]
MELTDTVPGQDDVLLFKEGVKDFSPLYALRGLKKLIIKNKNLINLSFLSSMTDLNELVIESDSVKSFVELAACQQLVKVTIKSNSLVDLGFAVSLGTLNTLFVTTNKELNLEPLAQCKGLIMLNILDANIKSFETIASLQELSSLGLVRATVDSFKLRKQLRNLKRFTFTGSNQKFEMGFLDKLPKTLEDLSIENIDDINKVSILSSFVRLKKLSIEKSRIGDLKFTKNLIDLEQISIRGTSISDISPLLKLPKLNFLFIWDIDIQNVISSPNTLSNLFKSDEEKRKDNTKTELKAFKAKMPQCYIGHPWFDN